MRRSRANLPNRCCRQIDRIAYRAFDGKQWMDREGRAATTRNTYCGNLLWQSCLTLLALEAAGRRFPQSSHCLEAAGRRFPHREAVPYA